MNWRRKPTGITIPAAWLGQRRFLFQLGLRFRRVWFADHRSGWSGINFAILLGFWSREWCVIRWRTPLKVSEPVYSLRQQIEDVHGRISEPTG
jgi:hypothetical protein